MTSVKILKLFLMSSPQGVVRGRAVGTAAQSASFRLRPGERPAWIEVELADDLLRASIQRAALVGVSVDVAFALQLEWSLVATDIGAESSSDVVRRGEQLLGGDRMAPTPELRQWLGYLTGGPEAAAEHDLPSLALPSRVLARIPPGKRSAAIEAAAGGLVEEAALVVERAAATVGMTMESWAYRELALAR